MNKNLNKLIKYLDSKGYSKKAEYIEYLMKKESRRNSCYNNGKPYSGRRCSGDPNKKCIDICNTRRHIQGSGLLAEDLFNAFINSKIKITERYYKNEPRARDVLYSVEGKFIGSHYGGYADSNKSLQNKIRKALGMEEKK